jgi:hypothetical protein
MTAQLKCQERTDGGKPCGRPATHAVGLPGFEGAYPACDRCARFWAPNCRRRLTKRERRQRAA